MDKVLNIQLKDNDGSAEARILNVSGQVVLSTQLTNLDNRVDVQHLEQGIYFVEVKSALGTNRFKLIKR